MRGMPQKIQTPEDLRNLYTLWQDAAWQAQHGAIDTEVFISKIDFLCRQQFFHVPILKIEGNTVTTRFFHEAEVGCVSDGGLKITAVEHFTPPEDLNRDGGEEENGPTCTKVTLSGKLPKTEKFLRIKNTCNCTDYNGFDVDELTTIRVALQNALPQIQAEVR